MGLYGKELLHYRDNQILNEAYVGKTAYLEQIEEKIADLKANPPKITAAIDRDQRVYDINRLFEKQFGMDICTLRILPSATINAYTYSFGIRFDLAEKYKDLSVLVGADTSRGYYYKKGNNIAVIINVYYGLFFDPSLDAAQTLAIILHEIGHNFSNCLYNELYLANRELAFSYKKGLILSTIIHAALLVVGVGIPGLINDIKTWKLISNKAMNNDLKKNKKTTGGKIKGWISGTIGKFKDYDSFLSEFLLRIQDWTSYKKKIDIPDPTTKKGKEEYDAVRKSSGRIDEVFADKFAGVYGYGPELASALMIMDDALSRANKKIQTTGTETQKQRNLDFEDIVRRANIFEIHPETVQRTLEEIKLLKRELEKDDVDPKLKDMMEKQLSQLEELLKKAVETSDKLSKNDNARRVFNAYINNELPDAVSEEIEERIEQALDSAFETAKKQVDKEIKNK